MLEVDEDIIRSKGDVGGFHIITSWMMIFSFLRSIVET
jgi:hypothetical protein